MIIVGKKISIDNKYWNHAIWVIILFVIVEGVRYGRGVDYIHYIDVFNYDLESKQKLFTFFNHILKGIGINAKYAFFFYAIPFIYCGCILLKKMNQYATFAFPLFYICFISFHEAFIRQALSMSFIFIFIVNICDIENTYKENKRDFKYKIIKLIIIAVCAFSIHSIAIIAIFLIIIIYICFKKTISWKISIPILIFGKYIISKNFDWSYLNDIIGIVVGIDDKFDGYYENSDTWFSNDAIKDKYTRSFIIELLEIIGNCSLLYLGNKIISYISSKNDNIGNTINKSDYKCYILLYNIFFIGTLIRQTFYNVELMRRVSLNWYLFWFVPMSIVLYHITDRNILNKYEKFLSIGFMFWIWEFIRFLFVFDKEPLFIWNL